MKILDIPQSGKRGLNVSEGGRNGQISRILAIPSNPRSDAQMAVRHALSSMAAKWRTLTEEQRLAWIAAAKGRKSAPRLGQSGPLTGSQLFAKINCSLATLGTDPVLVPPPFPEFPGNPAGALQITNTGGAISLKLACPSTPLPSTTVRGAPPCSQGKYCVEDYRILGVLPTPAQGACDITSLYTARYGVPAVGSKVFIRVNQNVNGWEDIPVQTSAIVPAAT